MGRDYTVRRFAEEVLGGSVDPVMLGYIEKGTRFPSEALVRRLAALRKQDPHELLALLWRDRMLYAFGRELRRVLQRAARPSAGSRTRSSRCCVSQAIAALPDDGEWMPVASWRKVRSRRAAAPRPATRRRGRPDRPVEETLRSASWSRCAPARCAARGRHFVAESDDRARALALEFCALFVKACSTSWRCADVDTGTYLRNHYLNVEPDQLAAFQTQLDASVTALVNQFAADASPRNPFLNVLIASTVP